jgi:hypothetical protein
VRPHGRHDHPLQHARAGMKERQEMRYREAAPWFLSPRLTEGLLQLGFISFRVPTPDEDRRPRNLTLTAGRRPDATSRRTSGISDLHALAGREPNAGLGT